MMVVSDAGELSTEWDEICDYLLKHEDCRHVHKMVWRDAGEAFITETNGENK